jgi:hypothetical protein
MPSDNNEQIRNIITKFSLAGRGVYVFRINTPRADIACDDLVQDELAKINVFVAADKPTSEEHLLVVTTSDVSTTSDHVLAVLNDRYQLNAEFLTSAKGDPK